jgi:energy-coupling factor transporter transmembrane protein EcfT
MSILSSAARACVEGFTSTNQDPVKRKEIYTELLSVLLAFIVALVILGFVGQMLWNSVIIELFTFAKPARSFWQIIGLLIFLSLVRP